MGICPNCGNWISEGSTCPGCGYSGGNSRNPLLENNIRLKVDHAEKLKKKGELEASIREYEEIIEMVGSSSNLFLSSHRSNAYAEIRKMKSLLQKEDYVLSVKAAESKDRWELEKALNFINRAIEISPNNSDYLNLKAMILRYMNRYDESLETYDRSLSIKWDNEVLADKAEMLYCWAFYLKRESAESPNRLNVLKDAKRICISAIHTLPGADNNRDIKKFQQLEEDIDYSINKEKRFQKNLKKLKSFPKDELFTITGRNFYENNVDMAPNRPLKLVKEPDNKFDKDAIAVYSQDKKIGYVANNNHTSCKLTSTASELQDKIQNTAKGRYLLFLQKGASIEFLIGRIIK